MRFGAAPRKSTTAVPSGAPRPSGVNNSGGTGLFTESHSKVSEQ